MEERNTMFDNEKIHAIKTALQERGESIAVAESVTAGFLQAALASAEEAMKIFQGGMSLYNIGQKCRHLDVDPIHALESNCVSESIAANMARSISERFTSDWGMAVTGYATAVPESGDKIFAWFSIAYRQKVLHTEKVDGGARKGQDAQLYYVETMLSALLNLLNRQE